jgi:hypothetical protein
MGHRAGLDAKEEREAIALARDQTHILRHPSHSLVAIPTGLSRLLQWDHNTVFFVRIRFTKNGELFFEDRF